MLSTIRHVDRKAGCNSIDFPPERQIAGQVPELVVKTERRDIFELILEAQGTSLVV